MASEAQPGYPFRLCTFGKKTGLGQFPHADFYPMASPCILPNPDARSAADTRFYVFLPRKHYWEIVCDWEWSTGDKQASLYKIFCFK